MIDEIIENHLVVKYGKSFKTYYKQGFLGELVPMNGMNMSSLGWKTDSVYGKERTHFVDSEDGFREVSLTEFPTNVLMILRDEFYEMSRREVFTDTHTIDTMMELVNDALKKDQLNYHTDTYTPRIQETFNSKNI